eukprot:1868684-Pyramimonas_sp.AAC.2
MSIRLERLKGGVAVVTMDRPKAQNASHGFELALSPLRCPARRVRGLLGVRRPFFANLGGRERVDHPSCNSSSLCLHLSPRANWNR